MAAIQDSGSTAASYQYNAAGERVQKDAGGTDTDFVHDQSGHLIGEYTATGTPIREYVYLNGEPLALVQSGTAYYYHDGRLGTPQKLSDDNKAVVWDAVRTPFGVTTLPTNTIANPLRLPGQYADGESGLYQNGYRDYDPELGRYVQSDPIGLRGGINTYAYVKDNPINLTDPLGERGYLGVGFSGGVFGDVLGGNASVQGAIGFDDNWNFHVCSIVSSCAQTGLGLEGGAGSSGVVSTEGLCPVKKK